MGVKRVALEYRHDRVGFAAAPDKNIRTYYSEYRIEMSDTSGE